MLVKALPKFIKPTAAAMGAKQRQQNTSIGVPPRRAGHARRFFEVGAELQEAGPESLSGHRTVAQA